jgi:hypothetical protein
MFRCSLVIATPHDGGSHETCVASLVEVMVVDQNGDDRIVALPAIARR